MQWLKMAWKNRFFALVPSMETMVLLPSNTIEAVMFLESFESILLSANMTDANAAQMSMLELCG